MILTEFAPNETWQDSFEALKVMGQPRQWFQGGAVKEVKHELAHLTNVDSSQIHLTLSGRAAIKVALLALELPQDSLVAVQAFTCEAVVLPLLDLHLHPVYVDIESETFSMNLKDLKAKSASKPAVIILQHTFGLIPLFRKEILAWAEDNKISVIEDLAHGFQEQVFETDAHTFKVLSFGRSKMISSVHGGALITPDKRFSEKSQQILLTWAHPRPSFIFRSLMYKLLTPFLKATYPLVIGKILHRVFDHLKLFTREISELEKNHQVDSWLDKKYPNALAQTLVLQLKNLNQKRQRFSKIGNLYTQALLQKFESKNMPLTRFPLMNAKAAQLISKARSQNIYLGTWYQQVIAPTGLEPRRFGYELGSCPQAETVCKQICNLPLNISEEQAQHIITFLKSEGLE
jgi:perosamine synthetase